MVLMIISSCDVLSRRMCGFYSLIINAFEKFTMVWQERVGRSRVRNHFIIYRQMTSCNVITQVP